MTQDQLREKLKRQYPDYIDDPDGLERFRQAVLANPGHDMAAVNHNSLGRLIDTIDRLRRECDDALLSAARAGVGEVVVPLASLKMCRDVAMEHTAYAHIPECGKLSLIAQELDACLAAAPATQPSPPAAEQGGAPDQITYNPVYQVTYEGADPTRGHVYTRVTPPAADAAMVEELLKALEPFSELAKWIEITHPDRYRAADEVQVENWPYTIGIGQLQATRTALDLASRQPAGVRCGYCDGTGDVHRADGEWLGKCVCAAAPATNAGEK